MMYLATYSATSPVISSKEDEIAVEVAKMKPSDTNVPIATGS